MHERPASDFLIYGIFWAIVLVLVARILWAIYRWRTGTTMARGRWANLRNRIPKWLASGIVGLLLTAGCLGFGIWSMLAVWRWRSEAISARDQKTLTLDLHIPHVIPQQTYTVVARFRVRGSPYASRPLHIQFGSQKPVYHLLLYYDPTHPERNAWTALRADTSNPQRAAVCATGSMILAILLLEWLEFSGVSCRDVLPLEQPHGESQT